MRPGMPASKLLSLALVVTLAAASTGCRVAPEEAPERRSLALMTTLPIYWSEADDVGELLKGDEHPAQARQALERRFSLEPLDTLEAASLASHKRLLLAQPRALSPSENVALDDWVRAGGRLLLFADPMLTRHSHFAVGDRRRSQDVILLSPILTRWGLNLAFDPDQSVGERLVETDGFAVPVALAGSLSVMGQGACKVSADATLARCAIGRGQVTVLADAAVLEDDDEPDPARGEAIQGLLKLAFD